MRALPSRNRWTGRRPASASNACSFLPLRCAGSRRPPAAPAYGPSCGGLSGVGEVGEVGMVGGVGGVAGMAGWLPCAGLPALPLLPVLPLLPLLPLLARLPSRLSAATSRL